MELTIEVGMMYKPKFNSALGIVEYVHGMTNTSKAMVEIGWIQSSDGVHYATKKLVKYPADSIADAIFEGKARLFHPDKMDPNLAFSMKRRKS